MPRLLSFFALLFFITTASTLPVLHPESPGNTLPATSAGVNSGNQQGNDAHYLLHKKMPGLLRKDIAQALSYFPDLADVRIDFVFRDKLNKAFMQAQPKWYGFFQSPDNRHYIIKISRNFQLEDGMLPIEEMPRDALLGWLAHELGHIMDYQEKSAFALMAFGLSYITSHQHMIEAERNADIHAIRSKAGPYILQTKDFIHGYQGVPQAYREKIARFYMTPGEAMQLMDELSEEMLPSE